MLYQLAYMSTSTRMWTRPALLELLRCARDRNAAHDITGVLLFRNGGFLQLLEGEHAEVTSVFDAISADERHRDVVAIWETQGAPRWFPGWSMGFRDLEEDPLDEPGLIDVLRGPLDASAFSHEAVVQLWTLLRQSGDES